MRIAFVSDTHANLEAVSACLEHAPTGSWPSRDGGGGPSAPSRITYHVLEAQDPGAAIIEFARVNNVDQIVIGSRGSSTFRRYLGSVSSQVVAQASCTVTVVKAGSGSLPGEGRASGRRARVRFRARRGPGNVNDDRGDATAG